MRIIFLLLVAAAYGSAAQQPEMSYRVYDFSEIDPGKIDRYKVEKQLDSIYRNSGYDSLLQLLSHARSTSHRAKYVGFVIGYQATQASLSHLKNGLNAMGFNSLSENFGGVPWGTDLRGKRLLASFILVPGLKNTASNSDYKIEVNGINLELVFGYDVLNLKRLHFYPQLSLSLQDLEIEVKRKTAATDVTNVNQLILNPAGTSLEKSSFNLAYGVELDYHLAYSAAGGGIILGLRYGRTTPLVKGKYTISGGDPSSFKSPDIMNESFFSVVLKFYMKMQE
jgi:hypothetical protein